MELELGKGLCFDFIHTTKFLEEACKHYERSAPTVEKYLNGVYEALTASDGDRSFTDLKLWEINQIQQLYQNGQWEDPHYAANRIYKLMHELGLNTTGHAGF